MLTAAQKAQCATLAQALDRGDTAAYKRAADSLTPEMKGEVWDQRAHVKAQAARAAQSHQKAAARVIPTVGITSGAGIDLDYWATDDIEPDDDDDSPNVPPRDAGEDDCEYCNGTGKVGNDDCEYCQGTGKAPAGDGEEEDKDDEEE